MNRARIVIIDSGINTNHEYFSGIDIEAHTINSSVLDINGHGTAVCGIIVKQSKSIHLVTISIFDQTLTATCESLIEALCYIRDHIECDIINLSLGMLHDDERLRMICEDLTSKGVIIVAAFDNSGAISYPAAYPFVIGVDASIRCTKPDDFVFIENSIINIRAKGGNQRVAWYPSAYTISQGASFAAGYVTAYVANLISAGIDKYEKIMENFKEKSRYRYNFMLELPRMRFDIEAYSHKVFAAVPYNKEIHSLLNFRDHLKFHLEGIYDTRYSGNVGLVVKSINRRNECKIRNVEDCDYSGIDVMIIGHMGELDSYTRRHDKKNIVKACYEHHVDVFSFDDYDLQGMEDCFKNGGLLCYVPKVKKAKNKFGKLYNIGSPVLGIFGTTKQQGKFTLQLQIRYALIKKGYKVGQIGTEPSAELFGMRAAFPFGYNSQFQLSEWECIESINELMHELDYERYDIIIVGSQSGTVPMIYQNVGQFPVMQIAFLEGIMPDGVILCVNISDEIEYIIRTIKAIEGVADCRVFLLAIYPMQYETGWGILSSVKKEAKKETLMHFKQELKVKTGVPSIVIGNEEEEEILSETIIEFFS